MKHAANRAALGRGGEEPQIDRSSIAQHRELARRRVAVDAARDAELDGARLELRLREAERLKALLDRPLPEFARCFVNDCFAEVDAAVATALVDNCVPEQARSRAARLYARRLPLSATLREVLAFDPRQGTLPMHDTQPLAMLRNAELPARARDAQRQALHERFLRQPHRSRYPFLHDLATGWFMHAIEGGAVKPRRDLRIADVADHQLAAYFVSALGRTLDRSAAQVAALSFADNAFIEQQLTEPVRDLLFVCAELAFRLEPLVLHRWRESRRRLVGDVLLFFGIPSLERLSAARGPRSLALAADAGRLLEGSFDDVLRCAEPEANEVDVARMLGALADELWRDPRNDLPFFDLPPPTRREGLAERRW